MTAWCGLRPALTRVGHARQSGPLGRQPRQQMADGRWQMATPQRCLWARMRDDATPCADELDELETVTKPWWRGLVKPAGGEGGLWKPMRARAVPDIGGSRFRVI
ncbi:hypothetical protein E4U43_005197 [Claviceps pusilla]|uniref:Uncharacterized protein n=1 Tax=Claviceps pusilla TaxID=123648 RepID=A0A9P7NGI9_9HYPO|nr:hypothetical protein E4U43_005197 [Claviceps pusilla]